MQAGKKRSLPLYLRNNNTGEETFGIVTLNLDPTPQIKIIRYGPAREIKYIEKIH